MENPVIVKPRFHTGFSNNDFLKEIASRQQRTKFGFLFVFIVDIKCRLNIIFIHTVVHHKIYFALRLMLLTSVIIFIKPFSLRLINSFK